MGREKREEKRGEVILYKADNGRTAVDVRLHDDSVWLTLNQMADLFDRDKSVISRHLKEIFESRELSRRATVAKNATVQQEGARDVRRTVEYYNLDAILSVGYRVNSKRGTQFRIWATQILKEHLTRGYTINRRRLEQNARELEAALQLIRKTASRDALTADEGRGLVDIIARYTQTFLATGSGKTVTAISFIYRLIKFAGARRILFLVERNQTRERRNTPTLLRVTG